MALRKVAALLAIVVCCYGNTDATSDKWLAALPWSTRHSMLNILEHLGLEKLAAAPVPIYRPDLGDQIAYWLISYNDNDFAILSAGPHSGDYKLVMQGKEPSVVVSLDRKAMAQGKKCSRYLLLTPSPDLNMACDVTGGQVQDRPLTGRENITRMWSELRKKVDKEAIWEPRDPDVRHFRFVSPSHPASFPLTGSPDCHIQSLGLSNGTDFSVDKLCRLLGVCDHTGRVHTYRKTPYGEVYVHLKPDDFHESDIHDLHFEVVGKDHHNNVVVKGFAMQPKHRARRQISPSTSYSIDDSNMMPDYNQFSVGSCEVGCGPVAWAQVFGYFDRRSHEARGSQASRQLYRCGSDGTTGNDTCEAPATMTEDSTRIENYIRKMNQILQTFCLGDQGATWQSSMNKVQGFFTERQGGNANIQLHTNGLTSLIGVYSDAIRDKALAYLRDKWPVIVGIRVSGIFSQHYPVMTQYRQRSESAKTCTQGTSSCTVADSTEYDMFLHMGWGGSQNGWRKAEMFMAAVARY